MTETATHNRLIVINQNQSLEIPFAQQITIGRDVINTLALLDTEISRSHAIIYMIESANGPQMAVKDLDSLNGVYVNGVRIKEGPLKSGDELVLGSTILLLSPEPSKEIEECLSEKGRNVFRRIRSPKPVRSAPITAFSLDELDEIVQRETSSVEHTAIWSAKNAASMMHAMNEMCAAPGEADFYRAMLTGARELAPGAEQGVIMMNDAGGKTMGIRALFTDQAEKSIVISQTVIRIVMKGDKAFFSPDVATDERLPDFSIDPKEGDPHTLLAVPIEGDNQPAGFLYLDSINRNYSFDQWTLTLIFMLLRPAMRLAGIRGFLPKST